MRAELTQRFRASLRGAAWISIALAIGLWAHAPTLRMGLFGDDFEHYKQTRMASKQPLLLIAPFEFFRPARTMTYALNAALFGTDATGYRATNLALFLLAGFLLWHVLGRLAAQDPARAALVVLWLCSPYSVELQAMIWGRVDSMVLIGWLGLALIWPGAGEQWRPRAMWGAAALVLLTALSKESWIVLPGLVFVFETGLRARGAYVRILRPE